MPVKSSTADRLSQLAGYLLAAAYFVCLTALAWQMHGRFLTHAMDLGYFDQIVWSAAHGAGFANTLKYPWNFMGDHLSPILYLIAPFYWVWPDVRALLAVQTLALALAGLPLFRLARDADARLAPLVLAAFYLNPALQLINLSDFHEIALATPFISLALWALFRRRYAVLAAALFLALMCKEDVAIVTLAFGVFLLFDSRARGWGLAIAAFSVAWLGLAVEVIIPAFREDREYGSIAARYGYLGHSLREAVTTVLTRPDVPLGHLARPDIIAAFLRQLLPTGFTALLGWPVFALAIPVFLYLQLSDEPSLFTLQEWHVAPLLPILFAAAIQSLRKESASWRRIAVVLMVLGGTYSFVRYSPALPALQVAGTPPDRAARIESILDRIPTDSTVSAQSDIVPHVSQRARVFAFPSVIADADDIVLDRMGNRYPVADRYDAIVDDEVMPRADFRPVYDLDGLLWVRKEKAPPGSNTLFGDTFRLASVTISVADQQGFFSETVPPGKRVVLPPKRRLQLNLYWRRVAQVVYDCNVLVDLVDEAGRLVGRYDGPAISGSRSMRHLETGVVRGTVYLTAARGAIGPGEIRVGLYERATGRRLPTAGGQDHAFVGALRFGE